MKKLSQKMLNLAEILDVKKLDVFYAQAKVGTLALSGGMAIIH